MSIRARVRARARRLYGSGVNNPTSFLSLLRGGASKGLGAPLVLLAILGMMVVPLAPFALDLLFTFNIALSIVILLAVIYVMRPLEFSAFPTVLLGVTLLRLALNVASTRVVLLHGHEGSHAAGKVIEAFGNFVIGGHYTVGFIVFIILTIINFVVVTKGAERVSEVSARFVLDALPGKQMAIDADLNAGLLTREEAKARREDVREEADFYGSMDGASKFVRGDAIAGLLVLVINIIGGLLIGTMEHDLPIGEAARNYTLLTIGDGLVAQIPALLLSTAVAVLVTRMSKAQDMGQQLAAQIFGQAKALGIAAAVLALLGIIPGMPNLVFLSLAAGCGYLAFRLSRRKQQATEARKTQEALPAPSKLPELSWEDVAPEDALGLEVGYRLIPLVDAKQGGELMARIKGVRKKLTQDLGFLIPPVHIRDNLELSPNAYRVTLNGVPLASGSVHADKFMALDSGRALGTIPGIAAKDPTFGLDATWIERGARDHAQSMGYTVVDPATVVATHLSHLIGQHASDLFGHDEAQALLSNLAKASPKLAEDLVPKTLPMAVFVKVLKSLLADRVPIRAFRSIAEALAEVAPKSHDPVALASAVRVTLGRQIVQDINGMDAELPAYTLAPQLERLLQDTLNAGSLALEPGLAERMQQSIADGVQRQTAIGQPAVLLVPGPLRPLLSRFTRQTVPDLHVLAYNEVPESKRVRLIGALG
ncbi:flagellar biosynthesis protein FlhA [Hydrocarboniphaga effusa AP103]|uniref:Flagellar biosynthesis protein FlhA n=1 Tax=Hydrocarboniphaga effusa AP103 TaxID=1172194 RepID=I8T7P0_9GAMM|nr:flagellar biosynthesis protein FlhA [Hydrocarboniphaga effusa AP103]EIT70137.1 flagellar biosynthesis protein FlhA [Hydrocarboniphaga effusa AP103]